jgi:predicted Zn-ribbon and HTH transcriptional regulator
MAVRPAECPACGYEKPRRRMSVSRTGQLFESSPQEMWRCGLCAYEWLQPAGPTLPPSRPIS